MLYIRLNRSPLSERGRQNAESPRGSDEPYAITSYKDNRTNEVQVNLFKIVKTTVTVKQAAALYGLPITTTGMTRCPLPRGPHPQHEAE